MGLLDKLIEKKHLITYCKYRKMELEYEKANIPEKVDDLQKREPAIKKLEGRIQEIKRVLRFANSKSFQEKSIKTYRKLQGIQEKEDDVDFDEIRAKLENTEGVGK